MGSVSIKCECPTHIALKDLSVKPKHRTPLDRLGFPQRCCRCCSLRIASIFICIVSFIWVAIELQSADRFVASAFSERGATFKYCKMMYLVMCMLFILACGALMLGIFIRKEQPILWYVWYAFIFNCLIIVFTVAGTLATIYNKGKVEIRHGLRIVLSIIWSIIFFYLLMVVNSYKLAVWYLTLGFGIK